MMPGFSRVLLTCRFECFWLSFLYKFAIEEYITPGYKCWEGGHQIIVLGKEKWHRTLT